MDLTPLIPAGRQIVESYGSGRFRVSGRVFEGSILVLADRTAAWPAADIASMTLEDLAPVAEAARAGTIDLLLVGCGARMFPLPPGLRQDFRKLGVVIEPMDTGAACRTYNVLAAEGRRVAAALIAIS
ncbi:MAG TPA: Mth938-like domain-containing protein [Candidatus Angelobacter sp.]|nr:Mth938-like domain-containing protein [Candidatus Angelobacter sp.]